MPQYQGVWTLPVAARLQSTQQWATDPLYRNTTLLLQADNAPNGAQNNTFIDSSSNNFTITRNGNTTQGTFTPFSATGWGNFFSSSSFLTIPDNAAFDIGASEFSIEAFVYPVASANTTFIFGQVTGATGAGAYVLWVTSPGYLTFYSTTGGGTATRNDITSPTLLPLNSWSHVCVCRSGTTLSLYLNGVRVATQTYSATIFNSTNNAVIGNDASGNYTFPGYISQLRYLKGSSAYNAASSTLTVPTAPLTAITNTQLLTCQSNRFLDNSSNAFTLTAGGTPSVQAFSPFAPQYQWTAPVIGGSGYFDGTGDYLNTANNAAFAFGTGDYTIECWINTSADSGNVIDLRVGGNLTAYPSIYISSGSVFYWPGTGSDGVNVGSYVKNSWTHLAVSRSGSSLRFFINGVQTYSATNSTNLSQGTVVVGARWDASTFVTGYISSVRILKGTALYTAAFTPPTAPLTAIANTSLLLNFTNAGIVDGTMKNNLETGGNAQVSTSVVKYGTGSMAFDGTGDYLTSNAATTDLYAFGSGDFTIEMWVYFNNVSSIQCIYDSRPASTQGAYPLIYLDSAATIRYFVNSADQIVSSTVVASTWYHVAVVRANGLTRMFLNGVQTGSTYTDSTVYLNASGRPWVGINAFNGTQGLNGYLDDLRVTKGIARYIANFTPPTVALPRQ